MTEEYDKKPILDEEKPEFIRIGMMDLDYERYRRDLKEFDLTHEQENEFLDAMWLIMATFVQKAFDGDNCEQLPEEASERFNEPDETVDSEGSTPKETRPTPKKETSP